MYITCYIPDGEWDQDKEDSYCSAYHEACAPRHLINTKHIKYISRDDPTGLTIIVMDDNTQLLTYETTAVVVGKVNNVFEDN